MDTIWTHMDNKGPDIEHVAAIGVAGWALALELLMLLREKQAISSHEVTDLIQSAIGGIEVMGGEAPHPSFSTARGSLIQQLEVLLKHRMQAPADTTL